MNLSNEETCTGCIPITDQENLRSFKNQNFQIISEVDSCNQLNRKIQQLNYQTSVSTASYKIEI